MVEVNLIPKEYKDKKQDLLKIFSKTGGVVLILFILGLLLYGGLLLYKNKLNKDLENIKKEIEFVEQKTDWETAQAIIDLNKKLDVIEELFKNHFYWSELFNKIESLTVPQVYFSNTKLVFSEDKVNIVFAGNALTYLALARQVLSFQEEALMENVEVSGIALGLAGGIDFDISVIFSKDILLKK